MQLITTQLTNQCCVESERRTLLVGVCAISDVCLINSWIRNCSSIYMDVWIEVFQLHVVLAFPGDNSFIEMCPRYMQGVDR